MLLPKTKALQKRLAERFSRIEIKKSHGYDLGWDDWEEIGRCYYYLRDERANEHLRQAAVLVQQRTIALDPSSPAALFI